MEDRKILQELFLFRDAQDAIDALNLPEPIRYEKGSIIYGRDHFERALGIVLSGKVEAAARERSALNTFYPGDTFGAAALFSSGEYVSVIRAASRCRVQLIPEDTIRQLFAAYPQTAINYICFLSEKIRFLNGKIATYTSPDAAGRLYEWLKANCDNAGHMPTAVTMTKLAKLLSIGRTSLYRGVEELEKKGLIERKNGEVILL